MRAVDLSRSTRRHGIVGCLATGRDRIIVVVLKGLEPVDDPSLRRSAGHPQHAIEAVAAGRAPSVHPALLLFIDPAGEAVFMETVDAWGVNPASRS